MCAERKASWIVGLGALLSAPISCGGASAPDSAVPAMSDEQAVLKQELGEMPAPKGPCPERTEPNVLGNPRAAVQRTALGLAYCLLQEGPPGAVPGPEDTVEVHYVGTLVDGTTFDSSVDRGEPVTFGVGQVIPGWTEALQLMGDDIAHYCERAGLVFPTLRLSRAQRRWGSCSGPRDRGRCIRVNWRLVQAPDLVRHSVVAHEVAHLVHFDHSPAFRALLGELFEADLAAADDWLRREGRGLYAAFG